MRVKSIFIEKSTGSSRDGTWQESLDLAGGVDRFVVGLGPGSFAGIRAALSFAIGYAIGHPNCEVLGLPSACALVEDESPLAVIGDARRGMFWIALFDGFKLATPIFQVGKEDLEKRIPQSVNVVTPDGERIGETLKEIFSARYLGDRKPTAAGLERFALHNPSSLIKEPLPIYLNPAVR